MRYLVFLALAFLLGCATQTASPTDPGSMVADARMAIDQVSAAELSGLSDYVVIDVREPGEFAGGHLPGATNVPRGLLEFRVAAVAGNGEDVNPATPILVYCQSGARGALATLTLNKMGYSNVTNLADGFLGWKAAGGEVAKPE